MSVTVPAAAVDNATRHSRARVPLTPPDGLLGRLMQWYSRRTYGDVLDVGLAMSHNRPVLVASALFERRLARWKTLDPQLKQLAVMAAAVRIGCSWCVDFGYYEAHARGIDLAKLSEVPRWQESTVFTAVERRVLEYADAVTATPPTVTDELAGALRSDLGDAALVELTMMVAVENQRSRVNAALGLASQGFSESCRVPAAR